MRKIVIASMLLTITLLCSNCERVVEFDGEYKERKLVLNSFIGCNLESNTVTASKSAFIFAPNEYVEYIDNLPMEIKVNGIDCDNIQFLYTGEYAYRVNLKAKDKITIKAYPDNGEVVTAEEIMPDKPTILSVDTARFFQDNQLYMRTLIKIKDIPGERNYFRLHVRNRVIFNEGSMNEYYIEDTKYFINQDIVLSSLSGNEIKDEGNLYRIFPDDLFKDKEYTINVYFTFKELYPRERGEIIVELQAISESMYLYLRSLELAQNREVFDEPVKLYSNIKGGYGIWGTYNSRIWTVNVK